MISRRARLHLLTIFAALVGTSCAFAAPAGASLELSNADVYFAEEDGPPAKLAGAHPYSATSSVAVSTFINGQGKEQPEGSLRNLEVELPPGVVGVPAATPRCSGADFADIEKFVDPPRTGCSNDTVVGYIDVNVSFFPPSPSEETHGGAAVYNLEPAPGSIAKFGFLALTVPVTMEVKLSEEPPYRVVTVLRNTSQAILIYGAKLTLWGSPLSSTHDPFRGTCFGGFTEDGTPKSLGSCPASPQLPRIPLLTLPRACQGPLTTFFTANSWEEPQVTASAQSVTHDDAVPPNPIGFEDCEALGLDSEIGLDVSSSSAESPSGLGFRVDIDNPGLTDPSKRADSDIKRIVAKLPEGVTLNPSAANGLVGCSTAQLAEESLDSLPAEGCPEAAKVGTVIVESPLVDEVLSGSLFVAQPDNPATSAPGAENPFDSFLAVYLVLRNENLGVIVKQAGKVEADPVTGQVTTTFDEIPQIPFSRLVARFREGPRAPLATPGRCGTYVAEAEQTPWANPSQPVTSTASFEVSSGPGGGPCPAGDAAFRPGFAAGTSSNLAGSFSPLSLRFSRNDGERELTRISVDLPPGLTGKLAGVARCADPAIEAAQNKTGLQEIADPSCPAASQVGKVLAGTGVGPSLTYVPGKVYLSGPFAGSPFSLVVITPAVAGPFDIGNVVIREGLEVDPTTAEVRVDGDSATPLPRILKGVPVRLRDLRIEVDRQNFTLNPTSCEPFTVDGGATGTGPLLTSAIETVERLSVRFQASRCERLGFEPRLKLRLTGGVKRTAHPALRAELRARAGDANISRAAVILPHSQFIDQAHINNPCTRVQYAADACPPGSVLGRARAFTPLLDRPLEGPVYFRSNGGERNLPDIVADLRGEAHVVLVGFVDVRIKKGTGTSRIRTAFRAVPDVPVSKFVLSLRGGKRGLLQNSSNLCATRQTADVRMKAHNGKRKDFRQLIKTTSCRKKQ
ncbi:MAG TPA: hypothetical protein VKB23_09365 [Solirubrobacterales bacterium]|nr:hypothetical protein [Solirubrobacterales bacterium]